MQVLSTQAEYVDNSLGSIPLEYSRLVDKDIVVPESLWFDTGHIQLQTVVRLQVTDFQNPSRGSRFLNPTTSQWGYIAMMCDNYTMEQRRIEFDNQQITMVHPEVAIASCRNTVPRAYAKTANSGKSHFWNIAEVPMCLKESGVITSAPGTTQLFGEGKIPDASICLAGLPASESYLETNVWGPFTNHEINIDRTQENWVDEIRGVLWPFTTMVISIETLWSTITNQQPLPALPRIIQGDAPFPIYTYGCAFGNPVPSLTNPPCPSATLVTNPVTGTIGCQINQVP